MLPMLRCFYKQGNTTSHLGQGSVDSVAFVSKYCYLHLMEIIAISQARYCLLLKYGTAGRRALSQVVHNVSKDSSQQAAERSEKRFVNYISLLYRGVPSPPDMDVRSAG